MSTETNVVAFNKQRVMNPSNNNNSSIAVKGNKNAIQSDSESSSKPTSAMSPLELLIDKAKLLNRTRARHNLYDSQDFTKPTAVMRYLHDESFLSSHPYASIHNQIFGLDLIDSVRTNFPFIYRINDGVSNNTVLQAVCQERGWQEFSSETPEYKALGPKDQEYYEDTNWNLWWAYRFYVGRPYRSLKCWQFTNHNPRTFQICSKIYLSCFIRRMFSEYGAIYDFIPKSFVLPAEYIPFVTEHSRRQSFDCADAHNIIVRNAADSFAKYGMQSGPQITNAQAPGIRTKESVVRTPIWITKPPARSQGKGIYLFTDMCDVPSSAGGGAKAVVQEYITNPYLIAGYKWDMRIYVCVVSVDPLLVYMYREGLVRFATEKYDMTRLTSSFSHLTNSSLNKLAPGYSTDKEVIGPGCKWSFKQLRAYFKGKGINDWLMWQRIMSIVVLTVVGESLNGGFSWPLNRNCFDFLGFDIIINEDMRPFLLEVNYSPGLGGDCEVDNVVKKPMLHELFDLLGMPNCSNGVDEYSKAETIRTRDIVKERLAKWTRASCDPHYSLSMRSNNIFAKSMIDCSSKGRLKDARAIYSQDFIAPYLQSLSNMPKEKLSAALKTVIRRRKLEEEQLRFNQELKQQKFRIQRQILAESILRNKTDASVPVPPKLLAIGAPDPNHIVAEFVHEDQSSNNDESIGDEAKRRPVSAKEDSSGVPTTTKPPLVKDLRKGSSKIKDSNGVNPETAFIRPAPLESEDKKESEEDTKQYVFIKRPDWANPPKSCGDWVLVYPNQCTANYRSPYKNPIAELRVAVENMEHYVRVSKGLSHSFPNHSDDSYRRKLKSMLSRWDADIWVPSMTSKSSEDSKGAIPSNNGSVVPSDISDCETEKNKEQPVPVQHPKPKHSTRPQSQGSQKPKLIRKQRPT